MKLIVDSGSTKAKWAFVNTDHSYETLLTRGINPFVDDLELVSKDITVEFDKHHLLSPWEIYFYGAGCKNDKAKLIRDFLSSLFPKSLKIEVESDLLGAARAIFGNKEGIIAILGTGSNAGHYNGSKLFSHLPSLGYILGDYGSGYHIGKLILQDYFNKKLDSDQRDAFTEMFQPSSNLLQNIYDSQRPNQEIARFSRYLQTVDKGYKEKVLKDVFQKFLSNHILPYQKGNKLKVGFCGSIAFHFKRELEQQCNNFGISIVKVIKDPIIDLINFHSLWQI